LYITEFLDTLTTTFPWEVGNGFFLFHFMNLKLKSDILVLLGMHSNAKIKTLVIKYHYSIFKGIGNISQVFLH